MSVSFKARVVQAILIRESAVNFSKRKESKNKIGKDNRMRVMRGRRILTNGEWHDNEIQGSKDTTKVIRTKAMRGRETMEL